MIPANDQDEAPIAAELDLMAYLDGELEDAKAAEVEARLASDAGYRARLRALEAVGGFLKDDASRIYADARVDSIVDSVMSKLAPVDGRVSRVSALPASSRSPMSIPPPSNAREKNVRSNVVWVTFGAVAAAAAALIFYVNRGPSQGPAVASNNANAPATIVSTPSPSETVVAVKTTAPLPSNTTTAPPLASVEESVEVHDLEVGEGATVFAQPGETKGSSMVVWVSEKP